MDIKIHEDSKSLGYNAALQSAEIIKNSIEKKGYARIILSTGASQFDTLESLVKQNIDWSKVEMFHLDEYVSFSENHPASFRKYLKERFIGKVNLGRYHLVNGEGDIEKHIDELSSELRRDAIDLGLIGIGENGHIAFNDPPADFDTKQSFIIVNLDEECKKQQVGEGWFASTSEVPKQAISMSVYQIMQCKNIISCVPYGVKANAIKKMLENDITNMIPATILRSHQSFTLHLDKDSASLIK